MTLSGITGMIKNDHVIVFLGDEGMHVLSKDNGKTYSPIHHAHRLGEFKLHPRKPNLMLASTLTARCYTEDVDGLCYKHLLISDDYGASWRIIQDYVVQFDWVHNMKSFTSGYDEEAIFATMHGQEHKHRGHQVFGKWDDRVDFVVSSDRFLTHTVLVPRGNRYLFTERYMAVAQVEKDGAHVVLQLSSDGGKKFFPAELEYPMTQHSYTILDTSNDAIFLHVNHNGEHAQWGNVYISNSIGTNFSLTLPHNRRDANGKCDFEKLQSMEGVYVANYFENVKGTWQQAFAGHVCNSNSNGNKGFPGVSCILMLQSWMNMSAARRWTWDSLRTKWMAITCQLLSTGGHLLRKCEQ